MATTPKPQQPQMGEIAPPESALYPLRLQSEKTAPFVELLQPEDSVLGSKGGIDNLRIYKELLRDDQVAATWQQRRLGLIKCDMVVEPGGDDAASKAAAEALHEELEAINWDDITDKMLYSVFYGWGVAEVIWRPNGSMVSFDRIVVRDRARFRFDRLGNLYLWASGSGWVRMPDQKFWTIRSGGDHHDDPYGLGLAHSLYWPVFFKRNDIKFWLVFLEKFGMPTTMAKMPPGAVADPAQREKAVEMLQLIAVDAGIVVPDNIVVELLEASRSGTADYSGMHDAMNKAISKIVVGQTMTTEDGSSLAQAKVHEGVSESILEADSDLLCGTFNQGPAKWWTEWNFPGAKPPRIFRNTAPQEDLAARAERDVKIKSLGYSPTEEYINETYGEGWEKAEPPPQLASAGGFGQARVPGGPPPEEFSEREFAALQALKAARRADQEALMQAAVQFAENYQTVMGRQVGALLEAAEISEDPDMFRRRMNELLEEGPLPEQTAPLTQGSFVSKMMGAIRAQRA